MDTAGKGWTTDYATINSVVGGKFHIGFKSPDEQNDFDFTGVYTEIVKSELIKSSLTDGGKVKVLFETEIESTKVTINFETEDLNSLKLQKEGWGKILANFDSFVERKVNPKNTTIF